MDPNVTLVNIISHIKSEHFETATHLAEDLNAWLLKGGFLPDTQYIRQFQTKYIAHLMISDAGNIWIELWDRLASDT